MSSMRSGVVGGFAPGGIEVQLPPAARERAAPPGRTSFERARLQIYFLLFLADSVLLSTAFYVAAALYEHAWSPGVAFDLGRMTVPLFMATALYQQVYSQGAITRLSVAIRSISLAYLGAVLVLFTITFYDKSTNEVSRVIFTLGSALGVISIVALRAVIVVAVRRKLGSAAADVLVIQAGGPLVDLPDARCIDAQGLGSGADLETPDVLDRLGTLMRGRDKVVVSCPLEDRARWAFVLRAAGVNGAVVSDEDQHLGAVALERHGSFAELKVSLGPLSLYDRVLKRAFDLTLTMIALVVLAPFLIVIALAIKAEDGGAILFRQTRVGRTNTFFQVLKFRTMREGISDPAGDVSTVYGDARVTRVGQFLRRTSLDELPQLFNVLRNEMSLVGPRPHALLSRAGAKLFWEVDRVYWTRHSLKPGLTGLAQVRGFRGPTVHEDDLRSRLENDLAYQRSWTLWRDVLILAMTIRVMSHRNAF